MKNKIVIFGEILWDCFPDKNIPGGAPMNVAVHTKYLGLDTTFISKVGNDTLGKELVAFAHSKSLPTRFIETDSIHDTSRVLVDNSDNENIRYEIVEPVAWDFMEWNEEKQQKVDEADAMVYGSLAARNATSRATLLKLLATSSLKIFDINLRAPHYSPEILQQLLAKADILKINEEELDLLSQIHQLPQEITAAFALLAEKFQLKMICLTKGSAGAMIYDGKQIHHHPGYKIKVEDTVGSGDAFLSGFIYQFLQGKQPEEILDFACALGALVATQKGGTPIYEMKDIKRTMDKSL
ncbi:fructokinase [Echinicola pacifica]|uniref:Fructokinase n=1 Tax=Echinicola pacifica TaxID=346377 RepID=A0A918UJF3_9BACT|nr:carbohydrate kinase [Echinicola pacifica]GGZ14251.1 fructokinase [Echinicola pacifica]